MANVLFSPVNKQTSLKQVINMIDYVCHGEIRNVRKKKRVNSQSDHLYVSLQVHNISGTQFQSVFSFSFSHIKINI